MVSYQLVLDGEAIEAILGLLASSVEVCLEGGPVPPEAGDFRPSEVVAFVDFKREVDRLGAPSDNSGYYPNADEMYQAITDGRLRGEFLRELTRRRWLA